MEKNIEIENIYQIYKECLTKKKQSIFELYYFEDLSLREIGENKKISYQAVRDTILKVQETLLDYEKKLQIYKTKEEILNACKHIEKKEYVEAKKILKKIGE